MWILQAGNAKRGWWRSSLKPLRLLPVDMGRAGLPDPYNQCWITNQYCCSSHMVSLCVSISLQGFVVKNYQSLPELTAAFQEINMTELYEQILPSLSHWRHTGDSTLRRSSTGFRLSRTTDIQEEMTALKSKLNRNLKSINTTQHNTTLTVLQHRLNNRHKGTDGRLMSNTEKTWFHCCWLLDW